MTKLKKILLVDKKDILNRFRAFLTSFHIESTKKTYKYFEKESQNNYLWG